MLEKIVIDNFKSFSQRTEIFFAKTNYAILPQNVSESGILKGTIFVGPNASGKSNVILAIRFLLEMLFGNSGINAEIYRCLFTERPSFTLEYYFLIQGKHIIYNLDIDPSNPFISENLIIDDTQVFNRIGLNAIVEYSDEEKQSFDENKIDKETLFLRTLFFNTKFSWNTTLRLWMEYLQKSVYVNAFEKKIVPYRTDIQEFILENYLKKDGGEKINRFFDEYEFNQNIEYKHEIQSKTINYVVGDREDEKAIFFRRKNISVPIPFLQESLGNQNLLRMLPAFFSIISEDGLLLIDEFSSGFHNDLEELLIKYFMENSANSQMIFVSHSTNLLSNSLLRPDQEYAVEFDEKKGSTVKRFSSESPRMAQNVEKMYLSGVFGGLPNYGKSADGDSNK